MSNDGKKKRQVFVKTITRFSPFQDQMSARLNDAISSLLSPIFSKTNSFVLAVCFSSPPSWCQFKYTSRVQNNNTKKERKRNERTNQWKEIIQLYMRLAARFDPFRAHCRGVACYQGEESYIEYRINYLKHNSPCA